MLVKLFKAYDKNVPDWSTCIENFNESANNNDIIKHHCPGFFVSHRAHLIKEVTTILQRLNLKHAHLYMNVTTRSHGFGNHRDEDDVYFWQCQGKTEWVIEDNTSYFLEPGDLIYIPKNVYHNVKTLTPRVGISMSM